MHLIILDRDGVINHDSEDYIRTPEEWVPIPGSLEAMGRLYAAGYRLAVATNQSGIGRGLLTRERLAQIHARMLAAVRAHGGDIEGIFVCPHTPEDGCGCRKPAPGLLHQIGSTLNVSLSGVYFVGDSERDVLAARSVAAVPVLVRTGKGARSLGASPALEGVVVFDDLAAFADALLAGGYAAA